MMMINMSRFNDNYLLRNKSEANDERYEKTTYKVRRIHDWKRKRESDEK